MIYVFVGIIILLISFVIALWTLLREQKRVAENDLAGEAQVQMGSVSEPFGPSEAESTTQAASLTVEKEKTLATGDVSFLWGKKGESKLVDQTTEVPMEPPRAIGGEFVIPRKRTD